MSPGEKRRRRAKRDRENAAIAARLAALREAGASCGSCPQFGQAPVSQQTICKLHSDFHGYALTTEAELCVDYSGARAALARAETSQGQGGQAHD